MRLFLFFFVLVFISVKTLAQISPKDSTFQVISYFDKNEKQNYSVLYDKYKIIKGDTTQRQTVSYDIEFSVLDSSAKEYKLQWIYKNFKVIKSTGDPSLDKIYSMADNCKIIYKTDELGIFKEVVNWKEVRDYIKKSFDSFKNEKNNPEIDKIMKMFLDMYSSKEAIESAAIQDILQFHYFHGAKYKLGEDLSGTLQVANLYGGKPFDAQFVAYLDELNFEELNGVLRYEQLVDKDQLLEATYAFMCELADKTKTEKPKKEDLGELKSETSTGTRIHDSGWVIYSVLTKTTTASTVSSIEERIIEIK